RTVAGHFIVEIPVEKNWPAADPPGGPCRARRAPNPAGEHTGGTPAAHAQTIYDSPADLNNHHGNWFPANQQLLSALEFANTKADKAATPGPRYQINHAWGDRGHTNKHGGAIFPDILR
ncbi:MAG: hypothetical protein ACHRHE_05445, partial [Tepidisphaerales bacterium]